MRSNSLTAWQRHWFAGLVLSFAFMLAPPMAAGAADPTAALWFDRPARTFQQSLPLDNGRIGAMVFAGE